MYTGRAFILKFPGDKGPHLHVVLSEPSRGVDAVVVAICSFGAVENPDLRIDARVQLTDGPPSPFTTSKESALDPLFSRVLSESELRDAFEDAEDKGIAKTNWLEWMRQQIFVNRYECRTMAVIDAICDCEGSWFS